MLGTNISNRISIIKLVRMSMRVCSNVVDFNNGNQFLTVKFQGGVSIVDHSCYICLVFVMLSCASVY